MSTPAFDDSHTGLWMMAHPVHGDERYSLAANLRHIPRMLRLCIEEGFPAIAPYYELCAAYDDTDPLERHIGRVIQFEAARRCDGLILTGHDLTPGMHNETLSARHDRRPIISAIGLADAEVRAELRRRAHLLHRRPRVSPAPLPEAEIAELRARFADRARRVLPNAGPARHPGGT